MTRYVIFILLLFNITFPFSRGYFHSPDDSSEKQCFCELKGSVDDCSCSVDTVDYYNNVKIYPRLKSILSSNYFRFFKVNLHNECPFWKDVAFQCAMKFCHVKACDQNDLPLGLKGEEEEQSTLQKFIRDSRQMGCGEDFNKEIDFLNKSISQKQHEELQKWAEYDEAQDKFCIMDDNEEKAEYVDLLLNPERYTGYQGQSAHRIWETIYNENCFKSQESKEREKSSASLERSLRYSSVMRRNSQSDTCLEERVFYRMVSGLHTSINIHLCANFLLPDKQGPMGLSSPQGTWGPNLKEFKKRFSPESTDGDGEQWLRNLYFVYLVELRAIAKVAPYLRNEEYFTGIDKTDKEVQLAIRDLLNVIEKFPSHFDESLMFSGASRKLKYEFREKFLNITRIMDCVGCDKCRLWGKLQTQGMGTALKILFSGKFESPILTAENKDSISLYGKVENPSFKMRRSEIVSLFNAFGRLSHSIHYLELFRNQLR